MSTRDTYNEDLKKSIEIGKQTDIMVATGEYNEAYKLFLTDPLGNKDLSEAEFIAATLDTMRKAYENWSTTQAHAKHMDENWD